MQNSGQIFIQTRNITFWNWRLTWHYRHVGYPFTFEWHWQIKLFKIVYMCTLEPASASGREGTVMQDKMKRCWGNVQNEHSCIFLPCPLFSYMADRRADRQTLTLTMPLGLSGLLKNKHTHTLKAETPSANGPISENQHDSFTGEDKPIAPGGKNPVGTTAHLAAGWCGGRPTTFCQWESGNRRSPGKVPPGSLLSRLILPPAQLIALPRPSVSRHHLSWLSVHCRSWPSQADAAALAGSRPDISADLAQPGKASNEYDHWSIRPQIAYLEWPQFSGVSGGKKNTFMLFTWEPLSRWGWRLNLGLSAVQGVFNPRL